MLSCDESTIRDSMEYFESVKCMGTTVFQLFDAWLQSARFKLQEEFDLCYSQVVRTRIRKLNTSTKSKTLTLSEGLLEGWHFSYDRKSEKGSTHHRESEKRRYTIGDITEFVEAKATNTRQPPSVWELPFQDDKHSILVGMESAQEPSQGKIPNRSVDPRPIVLSP